MPPVRILLSGWSMPVWRVGFRETALQISRCRERKSSAVLFKISRNPRSPAEPFYRDVRLRLLQPFVQHGQGKSFHQTSGARVVSSPCPIRARKHRCRAATAVLRQRTTTPKGDWWLSRSKPKHCSSMSRMVTLN